MLDTLHLLSIEAKTLLRVAEAELLRNVRLSQNAYSPMYWFSNGGEWMRLRLSLLRNRVIAPVPLKVFQFWGVFKYVFSLLVGISILLLNWPLGITTPLAIAAFYIIEVQFCFLFPLIVDNRKPFFLNSILLTHRVGFWRCLRLVLYFAAYMLTSGYGRKHFLLAWHIGCLAVLLAYEKMGNRV